MSTRIRLRVESGGLVKCHNASRETISVRCPGWEHSAEIPPNTKFEGGSNARHHKSEPLTPVSLAVPEPTSYPHGVRRATEADADALFLLVPQLLEETELLPISMQKIENLIEKCVTRQGGAICGVVEGVDGIDGSVALDVCESDVSDHRFIRALWLGLHPDLRHKPPPQSDPRSHIGRRLFEFSRWFHQQLEQAAGHPILMKFDIHTRVALGPKLALYERNVSPIGASFAYLSSGPLENFLTRQVEAA